MLCKSGIATVENEAPFHADKFVDNLFRRPEPSFVQALVRWPRMATRDPDIVVGFAAPLDGRIARR